MDHANQLRSVAHKEAHKSHKDRVNELNEYLDALPDYNDMPRIAGV